MRQPSSITSQDASSFSVGEQLTETSQNAGQQPSFSDAFGSARRLVMMLKATQKTLTQNLHSPPKILLNHAFKPVLTMQ